MYDMLIVFVNFLFLIDFLFNRMVWLNFLVILVIVEYIKVVIFIGFDIRFDWSVLFLLIKMIVFDVMLVLERYFYKVL